MYNSFRYRGYYYDTESGLYYLNSRYYDPVACRFINADGEISGDGSGTSGYNLYSYCMNDPVNMTDSEGNWPIFFLIKAVAVAVVACTVRACIRNKKANDKGFDKAAVDNYLSGRRIDKDPQTNKVVNVQLKPDKKGLLYNKKNRAYASQKIKEDYGSNSKRTADDISAEIFAHEFAADSFKFTEILSGHVPEDYDIYDRLSNADIDEDEKRIKLFEMIEGVFG